MAFQNVPISLILSLSPSLSSSLFVPSSPLLCLPSPPTPLNAIPRLSLSSLSLSHSLTHLCCVFSLPNTTSTPARATGEVVLHVFDTPEGQISASITSDKLHVQISAETITAASRYSLSLSLALSLSLCVCVCVSTLQLLPLILLLFFLWQSIIFCSLIYSSFSLLTLTFLHFVTFFPVLFWQ